MKRTFVWLMMMSLVLASAPFVSAAGTVTYAKRSICNARNGCLDRHRWTFTEAAGAASDATATADLQGRIVGVKFVETSITAATTVKLLDAAGRDVLQGLFTDTEASATATADNHYRVPIDDTSGGYIYVFEGDIVYIDISAGSGTDTGYVDVLVVPFD